MGAGKPERTCRDVRLGCDYYPEHWPEEQWDEDARRMAEAGFNTVRLADFAWAALEPEEGVYRFDWLDRALETLGRYGIDAVLCTPTAAPPVWLAERYPEILPRNRWGQTLGFGGRHHTCHTQPVLRRFAKGIAGAMARHYRDHPRVVGWQIDNELGTINDELCYCESCRSRFQAWLRDRYGSIEGLNAAWGTMFWSQRYSDWSQIPVPAPTPTEHSPSLLLAWKRFQSEMEREFLREQAAVIREIAPHQPVTHNLMGLHPKLDAFAMAEELDFVSWDTYPLGFWTEEGTPRHLLAMAADLMHSVKKRPVWVMEQQAGPPAWALFGHTPRPGQTRLWAFQNIARGADGILFFNWRTSRFGTEQFWHGVLPHHGRPGRIYEEVARFCREVRALANDVEGESVRAEIAVVFDYDQLWALQIQPHHPDLSYVNQLELYYRELYELNVPVRFIRLERETDLSQYKAIIAPLMFIVRDGEADRLQSYVRQGGVFVTGMRGGVKDAHNAVTDRILPGALGDLLGIEIHDYDCLRSRKQGVRRPGDRNIYAAAKWCDIVTCVRAEAIAEYTEDYYAGAAAVTRRRLGAGVAYYVGTEPDRAFVRALLTEHVLKDARIAPPPQVPEGVEMVRRGDVLFVLNHSASPQTIALSEEGSVLVGRREGSGLVLGPYDVAVLKI